MKLSIVMPVYNEINTVLEIIRRVQVTPFEKEIIVVDDYSTDGTREILEEISVSNIKVVFNNSNKGKGYSIREGFKHVSGDIVIIQDADLEYYPDEYATLIEKITEGKAEVVYGSRFLGAHRVFHFYHYLGNKLLNNIANVLYNTNLSDLMTCYKAFKSDVLKTLYLHADGFGIEAEITAQIFKKKLRVYEVPISYDGRDFDEGKKISWKDFFRSVYWLLRCKFTAIDVGEDTLFRMKLMKNNNAWVFRKILPYVGNSVLEVGSGIGNISKYLALLKIKLLILSDINEKYLDYLRYRFIGNPRVKIIFHNISSDDVEKFSPYNLDTILCINVLEHTKDDERILENLFKILSPGGRLILLVPALKILYGSLDQKLEHFRRYSKVEITEILTRQNFSIEKIQYHNCLGALGWFINSRVLRRTIINSTQAKILDIFIPILSKAEELLPIPFGLSLFVVCKK